MHINYYTPDLVKYQRILTDFWFKSSWYIWHCVVDASLQRASKHLLQLWRPVSID